MMHLYTIRKYGVEEYKVLCTGEWKQPEDYMRRSTYGAEKQVNFTTVPSKVTCPDCLEKIIAKKRAELEKMEHNLAGARGIQMAEKIAENPREMLDPENRGGL